MVSDSPYYSRLLSSEENKHVINLLGDRCEPMCLSIVQVYQTAGPNHVGWRKKETGVLVLVKDHIRRAFFFRVYCLMRRQLVYEHEVYSNLEYVGPKSFFHMFEAEDCITAFNFANEEEAGLMFSKVQDNLQTRKRKKQEKRLRATSQATTSNHLSSHHSVSTPQLSNGSFQRSQHSAIRGKDKKRDKSEKKKLCKADIGLPQNFKHVTHVGWDPIRGFDVGDLYDHPELRQFFAMAGVSEQQLKDKETREFIYTFLDKNGGVDQVKREIEARPPPPIPARSTPSSAVTRAAPPPPPPPSRSQPLAVPPAPSVPLSFKTQPQQQNNMSSGTQAPPPPPPPPPMSSMPNLSTPAAPPMMHTPAAPPPAPAVPDPRAALMDAIRSGKALKPVSQEERNVNGRGDTRAELMDEIRQGKELKAVVPAPRPAATAVPSDTLAGALARALADRSRAIHSDSSGSSSEDEEDDDDEDWED